MQNTTTTPSAPSWIRGAAGRANKMASTSDSSSGIEAQQQQQQQQYHQLQQEQDQEQARDAPSGLRQQLLSSNSSSPPSGFASSFSAFFPAHHHHHQQHAVAGGGGGGSNNSNSQLGDYPLFSSRRGTPNATNTGAGASSSRNSVTSSSPPFGASSSHMTAANDNVGLPSSSSSSNNTLPIASTSSSSTFPLSFSTATSAMLPPAPGYAGMAAYMNSAGTGIGGTARYRRPSVLATSSSIMPDDEGLDAGQQDEENEGEDDDLSSRRGGGANDLYDSPIGSRLGSVSGADQDDMQSMRDDDEDDDVDMDLAEFSSAMPSAYVEGGSLNNNNNRFYSHSAAGSNSNQQPIMSLANTGRTAAVAIPNRARSHSQSSSVMATSAQLARSPSAWPSSPPRSAFTPSANPQHLLARLTSEQQQAMAASASSASSAYYMIPTPYRQAMGGTAASGGDLLLGGTEELKEELSEEEEVDLKPPAPQNFTGSKSNNKINETTTTRGFNPLNPYSERPSAIRRDSSLEGEVIMENGGPVDDPQQQQQQQQQQAPPPLSAVHTGTSSSSASQSAAILRSSKSSPSLAGMNALARPTQVSPTHANFGTMNRDFSSAQGQVPFPPSNPGSPSTMDAMSSPFKQNANLRRSQSASHRPAGLLPFSQYTRDPLQQNTSPDQSDSSFPPLTAPPMGANAFRFQRANSLSDISRLQRHNQFGRHALAHGSSGIIQPNSQQEEMAQGFESQDHRKSRQPSNSSGSESPNGNGNPKVVRRVVNHKKGSLMPKSKDHLRTMAQLRLETGEFEVASEAALHRLSQSSAAAPAPMSTPSRRNTTAGLTAFSSPFASLPRASTLNYGGDGVAGPSGTLGRPTSSHGPKQLFQPTRNRFPETVVDDEDDAGADSSGSENDYASVAEAGMDPASASDTGGGMLMVDDEDVSSNAGDANNGEAMALNRSAWMLRDPAIYKPLTPGAPARATAEMDLSPSSALGWSNLAGVRPGKRKFNDSERFESYNAAFKRRAVSPASASSVSLSPLLAVRDLQGAGIPPAPPNLSTLGPAAQISSSAYSSQSATNSVPPSPVVGTAWSSASRSRGNSPAPSAISTSGRRWPEEEKERKSVDIGKMSLG